MSIYCSFGGFEGDWTCTDYSRPVPESEAEVFFTDGRSYRLRDEPCAWGDGCPECGGLRAPWVYQKSHIVPRLDDPRGGDVHLAYVADHIPTPRERAAGVDYAEDRGSATGPCHPWLRLSVNNETVVLHRVQVEQLVKELGSFLDSDFLPDEEYVV